MTVTNTVTDADVREIAERVRAALPAIAANGAESERRRWIADENVQLLADAGFFRLTVPRSHGGVDAALADQYPIIADVASACPSTAWVCTTWCAHVWMTRLYPAAAQKEVFASETPRTAGAFAPTGTAVPVEGGYRLSGTWKWNSGVQGANWDNLAATIEGTDSLGYALVPVSELTINDDWHAMGLAGTGSCSVSVEDLFVPAHRMMPLHDLLSGHYAADAQIIEGRAYPFFPLLLVTGIGLYTGMARGALSAFLDRAPGRPITYTQWTDQTQHPHVQIQTARAAARIEAADALGARLIGQVQAVADGGAELTPADRARIRGLTGEAISMCREAIELLWRMAGASAIMTDVPLQRFVRDSECLSLHAIMAPDANLETYGRTLLGLDPGTPFL